MRSSTLKNWTVATTVGAAIIVAGVAVAQSPAFSSETDGAPVDDTAPKDALSQPQEGSTDLPMGDRASAESGAEKRPTPEANGTNAPPNPAMDTVKDPAIAAGDGQVPDGLAEVATNPDGIPTAPPADPFDTAADPQQSDSAGETAFDPDTVKTNYQCAPPALSPAALLLELKRSRHKQEQERKAIEKTKAEILGLNAKLTEQSEAIEKRLAQLALEEKKADDRKAAEKKAADEKAQADAVAALEKKAQAKENPNPGLTPEQRAAQVAARRIEVQRLAATTKGMESQEAARFLGALDAPLAAEVIAQMKPKLAGAALAKMKPSSAAKIATLVVERK